MMMSRAAEVMPITTPSISPNCRMLWEGGREIEGVGVGPLCVGATGLAEMETELAMRQDVSCSAT